MRIPYQRQDKREKVMIRSFGGYERRGDSSEGSFFDMKNMTGDKHPYISTRKRRSFSDLSGAKVFDIMCLDILHNGKIVKNALVADCENRLKAFYFEDGKLTEHDIFNTTTLLTQAKKQTVIVGTRVYFFPDNAYYDMMDGSVGPLELHTTYEQGALSDGFYEFAFEPCDIDGNDSESVSPYRRLRRYCYKLTADAKKGEFNKFMSFTADIGKNDTVELEFTAKSNLTGFYNIVNRAADKSFIVVESEYAGVISEGAVNVKREVPKMDFVVSAKNRLWGCRYGTDAYGKCVNEIYASALSDPKNWHRFLGVSTDSFSASIGCGGAFTGAVCMDGNPVFFKEDTIIKVHGSYPSEFTITETAQRGIEAGSADSAVFVNDDLYYKTYSGIVRYDGGIPVNVDAPLGGVKYKNAIAGTTGDKYYVSMEDENGKRELFVYDIKLRLWYKEDSANIKSFCRCGGDLYFLCDEDGKSRVYSVRSTEGFEPEESFEWFCESTRIGFDTPDRKYVSSVSVRVDCKDDSRCDIYLEYDGNGAWHRQASLCGADSSHFVRLRPDRCDFFRIRLEGKGECAVRSVTRTLEGCSAYS